MLKRAIILVICFLAPRFCCCEVYVHAAASLTDVLKEIGQIFESQSGEKVLFNFGSSSLLARQIEEGAPGDIFFSADEEKMNQLEQKNLIRKETRKSILSNTLVIVVPSDSLERFQSILDLLHVQGNIAVAEPRSVPAGIYAREYLSKVGLWSRLVDRIVPTDNVRAALSAVEAGNASAGIVYKTDAVLSRQIRIAFEVPADQGPAISYSVAILKDSTETAFYQFLLSDQASRIFRKYQFLVRARF